MTPLNPTDALWSSLLTSGPGRGDAGLLLGLLQSELLLADLLSPRECSACT